MQLNMSAFSKDKKNVTSVARKASQATVSHPLKYQGAVVRTQTSDQPVFMTDYSYSSHLWWDFIAEYWQWAEHQVTSPQTSHSAWVSELFRFIWQKLQNPWNKEEVNIIKQGNTSFNLPSNHDLLGRLQSDSPLQLFHPSLSLQQPLEISLCFLGIGAWLCCWVLNNCCLVKRYLQENSLWKFFQLHYHKFSWFLLGTLLLWKEFPEDVHQQTESSLSYV